MALSAKSKSEPSSLPSNHESKKCSILFDEEEVYQHVSQKIRERKRNRSNNKVRFVNPPTRKSSKRKAPSPNITPQETDSEFKKPKTTRKKLFSKQPGPDSATRPEPPPRKSPLRDDLVPDPAKDELIQDLQSEITHLRGLIRCQGAVLQSLRMISGNANGTPLEVPSGSGHAMLSTGMLHAKAFSDASITSIDAISTGTVPAEPTEPSSIATKTVGNNYLSINRKNIRSGKTTTTTKAATTVAATNTSGRDKRYTGAGVCCCATTVRGHACAYIAVGTTKYCHMHADYDTKPSRGDVKSPPPTSSTGTTLVEAFTTAPPPHAETQEEKRTGRGRLLKPKRK